MTTYGDSQKSLSLHFLFQIEVCFFSPAKTHHKTFFSLLALSSYVAISNTNASVQFSSVQSLSRAQLFVTL